MEQSHTQFVLILKAVQQQLTQTIIVFIIKYINNPVIATVKDIFKTITEKVYLLRNLLQDMG